MNMKIYIFYLFFRFIDVMNNFIMIKLRKNLNFMFQLYSYLAAPNPFTPVIFSLKSTSVCYGITRGLILEFFSFLIYLPTVGLLLQCLVLSFHFYADDTQIYLSCFRPFFFLDTVGNAYLVTTK